MGAAAGETARDGGGGAYSLSGLSLLRAQAKASIKAIQLPAIKVRNRVARGQAMLSSPWVGPDWYDVRRGRARKWEGLTNPGDPV